MPKKIVHKRSSEKGTRPDSSYLTPGELALNINIQEPGAFFLNAGAHPVKIGPTHVGDTQPSGPLSVGEQWYDTSKDVLKLCQNPVLGFSEVRSKLVTSGAKNVFYVCPADPESSDSFLNDGLTLPFRTLNRAAIEVARSTIIKSRDDRDFYGRYTIVTLPGPSTVFNGPGKPVSYFTSGEGYVAEGRMAVLPDSLEYFNPEEGGVIIPRGCSLIGFEESKSEIRPGYVPSAESSILRVTGGTSVSNLTFKDKRETSIIVAVSNLSPTSLISVFETLEPNGLRTEDLIKLSIVDGVGSLNPVDYDIFSRESYWVEVLDDKLFLLRKNNPAVGNEADYVLTSETFTSTDTGKARILVTVPGRSHDNLNSISVASEQELSNFYVKVQKAFPTEFADSFSNHEITRREITNPVTVKDVSIESNHGLSGFKFTQIKGAKVKGVSFNSQQSSIDVYETYYLDEWIPLRESYSRFSTVLPEDVNEGDALSYYESLPFHAKRSTISLNPKGLVESDRRTYAIRSLNVPVDVLSSEITSGHLGLHAVGGGSITSKNNLMGSGVVTPFSSEGSSPELLPISGVVKRVVSPKPLEDWLVEDRVKYIPTNIKIQANVTDSILSINEPLKESLIKPYALKSGTSIWCKVKSTGLWKKAVLSQDYDPQELELRVLSAGNEIYPLDVDDISEVHIRRFTDDRPWWHKEYHLVLETQDDVEVGILLNLGTDTTKIRVGSQLNAEKGGLGQVFRVTGSERLSGTEVAISLTLFDFIGPEVEGKTYNLGDRITRDRKTLVMTEKGWEEDYTHFDQDSSESQISPNDRLTGIVGIGTEGTYSRGLEYNNGEYRGIINPDDGSRGLGLSSYTDPVSKTTISRFLSILGYTQDGINSILDEGSSIEYVAPSVEDPGYALGVGPWPVTFTRPSEVLTDGSLTGSLELFGGVVKSLS